MNEAEFFPNRIIALHLDSKLGTFNWKLITKYFVQAKFNEKNISKNNLLFLEIICDPNLQKFELIEKHQISHKIVKIK